MYLCYIDESGTPEVPGTTSHFVLAGLSIPIWHWKDCDREISFVKSRYGLAGTEIHTAWILRRYPEQRKIASFENLTYDQRRFQVGQIRQSALYRLQKLPSNVQYRQTKKNYRETDDYVHLTHDERKSFIKDLAGYVSQWGYARLFAECIDKVHFDPVRTGKTVGEQAFEQVISRFEHYLQNIQNPSVPGKPNYSLLIHDNNPTVARKHTDLMKLFHQKGTLWTNIKNIIETPLFVESHLTGMVQIADLCAYAIRRYLENGENELFDLIFQRADRRGSTAVGVRHYTSSRCGCKICVAHR